MSGFFDLYKQVFDEDNNLTPAAKAGIDEAKKRGVGTFAGKSAPSPSPSPSPSPDSVTITSPIDKDTKLQKFGKNFVSSISGAADTLARIPSQPQPEYQPEYQPGYQPGQQPVISASYGRGFGGGSTGPTPGAPGHGATAGWDDPPTAVVPVPQPIPQPMDLPQIPQMQLQMPQIQPQYQLGQPVMYSDKNLKTNISNTSKSDISNFIKSISKPKNYDYKDPANGPQTKGGLMAQDLEKSNIGKSAVINTPKGKAIDTARLVTILTSVTAHRFSEIDKKIQEALNHKFKKGKK